MQLPVVMSLGQVGRQSLSHPVCGPLHAASQLNGLVKGPVNVFPLENRVNNNNNNFSKLANNLSDDQSGKRVKTGHLAP